MSVSLTALLPQPKHSAVQQEYKDDYPSPTPSSTSTALTTIGVRAKFQPPPYGKRAGFMPRTIEDYGDGGAFPEIHTLQYPLDMGRSDSRSSSSTAVVPLQVDANGEVKFDAILRQGQRQDVVIHSGYDAMVEKDERKMDLAKPSADEEAKTAERTRKALGQIVERKIAVAMPTHVAKQSKEPIFIKYTPSEQNAAYNSGAQQRVIRVQEMPLDPLQPPKFQSVITHMRIICMCIDDRTDNCICSSTYAICQLMCGSGVLVCFSV